MALVRKGWRDAGALRESVLGWPPGAVPGDEDPGAHHLFSADAEGRDAAVVSFAPHPCPLRPGQPAFYFWALAVRPDVQRTGHGARLVGAVLASAQAADATVVWADARLTAVAFYRRLGATAEGDEYVDHLTGLQDQRVIFDLHGAGRASLLAENDPECAADAVLGGEGIPPCLLACGHVRSASSTA